MCGAVRSPLREGRSAITSDTHGWETCFPVPRTHPQGPSAPWGREWHSQGEQRSARDEPEPCTARHAAEGGGVSDPAQHNPLHPWAPWEGEHSREHPCESVRSCPGHQSPGEVWGRSLHPPLLTPLFLLLQLNHCPSVWQAVPAAPAVFAIAPGPGLARGSGDTRQMRHPALPEAPHTLGDSFPSPSRACPAEPRGTPALRAPAVTCPSPASPQRTGQGWQRGHQSKQGVDLPVPTAAVWAGRTRELLVHGGHREVVSLPASLPCEPHTPATHRGTWAEGGGSGQGAKLTGLNLCQATATPAQNILGGWDFKSDGLPGSGGLPVGSAWWHPSNAGHPVLVQPQCSWPPSSGKSQAMVGSHC